MTEPVHPASQSGPLVAATAAPTSRSTPDLPAVGPLPARLFDAAWRAAAYCLHPRVIWLSVLPLVLSIVALTALAWWGWGDANAAVQRWLQEGALSQPLLDWLDGVGWGGLRAVLVPLLLLVVAVPLVVVVCLLLVAAFMTPAVVRLVKARRFPALAARHSAPWWQSLAWSAGATFVALCLLALSLPLWFLPLVGLVVPPLIWGWLTYRVMAFDTLADLATPDERRALLRQHRSPLLVIGVVCGYLGAAPAALWAMGVVAVALAPVVLVVSIWLYTLVFAFSSLWFAHYLLGALVTHRGDGVDVLPSSS